LSDFGPSHILSTNGCQSMPGPLWGMIQQRVYQTRIHDITELKERLIDVRRGLQQSIVDEAIDEWRKHLRACVRVK